MKNIHVHQFPPPLPSPLFDIAKRTPEVTTLQLMGVMSRHNSCDIYLQTTVLHPYTDLTSTNIETEKIHNQHHTINHFYISMDSRQNLITFIL